jgi:hypothetical protein
MSDKDGHPETITFRDIPPAMSLRDHFAGQALAGLLAAPDLDLNFSTKKETVAQFLACLSYAYADAMLAERNKT